MLLTIDVGNTNTVYDIYDGNKRIGSFRLSTNSSRTMDELGMLECQYFDCFGLDKSKIDCVIISSVVFGVMKALVTSIEKYFGIRPLIVDQDIDTGLKYESPDKLGSDRSVAMIAAIQEYGAPLIMLDCGTATTVDAVSPDGVYMGGAIVAGLNTSTKALLEKAPALPGFELKKPDGVIGHNTIWELQAGAVYHFIGGLEYMITEMKREMGFDNIKVVATGGLSALAAKHCKSIDIHDPDLISKGLLLLYKRLGR